ncbi:MAG: chemotaxis protein CheW [Zoogloeaceae bacterium]|nr:chemotaxis protein CheW [Zoogloeaceae bacterium]
MARRVSLREFQESLARRLAESREGERRTLLGLQTPTESWLVDLSDTGEVLPPPPIADVPMTRPWYRGLINVRGNLCGVIDFSLFQGGDPVALGGGSRVLLIGTAHGSGMALLFSRATGLRSPEEFTSEDASDPRPWVKAVLNDVQGHRWLKLDLAALVRNTAFLEAGILGS